MKKMWNRYVYKYVIYIVLDSTTSHLGRIRRLYNEIYKNKREYCLNKQENSQIKNQPKISIKQLNKWKETRTKSKDVKSEIHTQPKKENLLCLLILCFFFLAFHTHIYFIIMVKQKENCTTKKKLRQFRNQDSLQCEYEEMIDAHKIKAHFK